MLALVVPRDEAVVVGVEHNVTMLVQQQAAVAEVVAALRQQQLQ